jgi:hypothetical protein
MKDTKPVKKLTRAQLREALDTVPDSVLLGRSANKELTPKMRKFAREVAKGATKADAYRAAYDVTSAASLTSNPYHLSNDSRVKAEVEAYRLALETAEHRTPAALRSLVIQTLAQVLIDPDAKQAVKVQAAKVLGTVTEVAAFTERKEVRTITSSEDARAQLMAQIRELTKAQAVDADIIERDAESLMRELENSSQDDPHRTPPPEATKEESLSSLHTIPQERTPLDWIQPDETPTPSDWEDPPGGVS